MRILIDIGHPGHVHLLKNFYHNQVRNGAKVFVTVKDIPIAKKLMDMYNIEYINLGKKQKSLLKKVFSQFLYNYKIYKLVKKNKIDVGIGTSVSIAHVSLFTKMKSILLDDDDDNIQPLFKYFVHPFYNTILSPDPIKKNSKNNISYAGTHELAYLHPERFIPNVDVIKNIGLSEGDIFFVIRFVALTGHHDIGHEGISLKQKRELINYLKPFGRIFITSEKKIEPEFEQYRIPVSPEEIHSLMYYATMFFGDSQTMTSEAALLGTPALKCNTFAGKLSVPNDLEEKYQLCYAFQPCDFDKFMLKVNELLHAENIKEVWQKRVNKFLSEKIDVTAFMVWFVENYPESHKIMKENPDYQYNFK